MEERFRFTGANPAVRLWDRFPNWQNAYDEEDLPDQDETTLRPADNQHTIDGIVSFTAGDAVLASGQRVPALLGVLDGNLYWVYVYPDPSQDVCWTVSFHLSAQRWVAMNEDWALQGDDTIRVPVGDSTIFPIRVTSRLPLERIGRIIDIEISDPG